MLAIQVFDSEKRNLFTLPLPHLLEKYQNMIDHCIKELNNPDSDPLDADEEGDEERDNEIMTAQLIASIKRWQADGSPEEANPDRNALILSVTFGSPVIYKNFMSNALLRRIIQIRVPATTKEEIQVQWTTPAEGWAREVFLSLDLETKKMVVAQYADIIERMKRLIGEQ